MKEMTADEISNKIRKLFERDEVMTPDPIIRLNEENREVEVWKCHHCGSIFEDGDSYIFCPKCGQRWWEDCE